MEPTRVSHFEIIRRIGRGGMGEVHEATDLKLRRRVALKFLSSDLAMNPEALERFEREALSAAKLNHPNIATVHAFEQEGDRPFIAMELLSGPSLSQRIEAGAMPVAEALAIARDVAAALAYAHREGTTHRDIKPENLMFDEHGAIKITDFGLARATMASRLTVTGTSLGTPAYMAPEAIRGETGPEADVFALGLVLYEMLAGRRAYPGDNAMAVMYAIANEAPAPLAETRGDVPEFVEALLAALLVKHPAERMDAATAARELSTLTGVGLPGTSGMTPDPVDSRASAPGGGAATSGVDTAAISSPTNSVTRTAAMQADASDSATPAATRRSNRWLIFAGPAVAIAASLFVILGGASAKKREAEATRIQREAVQVHQSGNVEQAVVLYRKSLSLNPKHVGALTNLGNIYEAAGNFTLAESLYTAAIHHASRDPKLLASGYYNLGSVQRATEAFPSAVASLRKSFGFDSSYADVYNNLGLALIDNGQAGDALVLLDRGIQSFPGEKFLYKNAARAALLLGDTPRALTLIDRALALDPGFFEARALRAQALASKAQAGDTTQ